MTQPGVYFTLDAPFVSIVGLYTNVLEGPGVISTQKRQIPGARHDQQLDFLEGRARTPRTGPRKAGERAVIIACHHPPASVDAKHGGSTGLADDIDTASRAAGLLAGRRPLRPRPPLPALHPQDSTAARSPTSSPGSGGFAATRPRGEVLARPR